jgi:hypothetical protein
MGELALVPVGTVTPIHEVFAKGTLGLRRSRAKCGRAGRKG